MVKELEMKRQEWCIMRGLESFQHSPHFAQHFRNASGGQGQVSAIADD
jgi:hypothetical protein